MVDVVFAVALSKTRLETSDVLIPWGPGFLTSVSLKGADELISRNPRIGRIWGPWDLDENGEVRAGKNTLKNMFQDIK